MGDSTRADNSGFRNHVSNYIDLMYKGELDPKNCDPSSKWQTEAMRAQKQKHEAQLREKYGFGVHTVEAANASETKEPGLLVRAALWVHSIIGGLGSSKKDIDQRDIFAGVKLSHLNSMRRDHLLQPFSEGEFKYLRGILIDRAKKTGTLDERQIRIDFRTLTKEALFSKYGGARNIVELFDRQLGERVDGVCRQISEEFTDKMVGKSGSKDPSDWKKAMDVVCQEAFEAACKAPEGQKAVAAEAVFQKHYSEQKGTLRRRLREMDREFTQKYRQQIDATVVRYREVLEGNSEGIPSVKNEQLRNLLFHLETQGLEHGLGEALGAARSAYDKGVDGILIAFDQTWRREASEMLDRVVADAEQYHEEHGASDLSTEKKQEMERNAESVNERRLERMEAGGIKFDNVMMDSAEDRKKAYEAGEKIFERDDYSELEGVGAFFVQMEAEAAQEIEEAAEKAQREAKIAALEAQKKEVRANIKSNEELLAVSSREGSDTSVERHFMAERLISEGKKKDKRLELEIVKIQAYDDEKQALVDELEQKRQEPGFENLSAWLNGFFSERIAKVRAERAEVNEQIRAIKKNSLNDNELAEEKELGDELAVLMQADDFTKEQAARFNSIEERHQFLASLNMTYDELIDLRMNGKLTDDQRVRLDAMEAKIENLRQKQAVCEQTIKVIEQVRGDYAKELSASRYSDPHADEPEAGTLERVRYNQEKGIQKTRAALQVDLPELTNEELAEIQSGLVGALGKVPLEVDDVVQIMDLIDKIPAEKADTVLEELLKDVEDKEILFATLLTNKAFVSLYQGVREDISRAAELSRNRSIEVSNRRDAEQRLLYVTQVSGKVQALCNVLSGDPGSVASKMQAAVTNLSDKEVRKKSGFFGGTETVMVFNPDVAVRSRLTTMAARARSV